ncbi:MAG TPA: prepilin-type N-terminal cleavage/methylation domain-containing protein [Armatimonadota bacterium]|jgi:prepilin-type N-terminal cleavage/methylation domain-containing protein/prepilin-type processing-associated H-X9-DG protein
MFRRNGPRGFTLIELLVVIAIIAILAAILFPVFAKARVRAQSTACMSNMKQLGTAFRMYADDNNDCIGRKYWEWHVDLEPYVKSVDVFLCPASTAPKPWKVDYPNGYTCVDTADGNAATVIKGSFYTNCAGVVRIYGNYARNDELIWNVGWGTARAGRNLSRWKSTADVILLAECRDKKEAKSSDSYQDANSPYIEPGGTDWTQINNQLSARHNNGQNCLFADFHAQFRTYSWLTSLDGRRALVPGMADNPGASW